MSFDSYSDPESQALLQTWDERYSAGDQDRRALTVEAVAAAALLLVAGLLAGLDAHHAPLALGRVGIVAVVWLVARRVRFPVASIVTWPAQLAFVPMLFLLPLPLVPLLAVGLDLLALAFGQLGRRRSPLGWSSLIAARVADCWYTLAPVAVLLACGATPFRWTELPVYALALVAQLSLDVAAGAVRTWFAEGLAPSLPRHLLWLYAVDASLACSALPLAAAAAQRPLLLWLDLPALGLLYAFARERRQRIEGTRTLSTAYRGTVLLLGEVIEGDDEYTGVHSREVLDLSLAVAARLVLDPEACQRVEFGALLHDVGKIRVPKEILHKAGELDEADWAVMRRHTIFGEEMLRQIGGTLAGVGTIVRHAHERWDGTGYPDGLVGEQIPLESRIIAAADAFNAMTTDRPYRRALSEATAVAEMRRCAGSQFDPRVVAALLAEISSAAAAARRAEAAERFVRPPVRAL